MKHLLIIYNDSNRAELLGNSLAADGYNVTLMASASLDFSQTALFAFDLVIIALHFDLSTAWETYWHMKKQYPELPVLVYIRDRDSLKSAIWLVLHKKAASSPGRGRIRLFPAARQQSLINRPAYGTADMERIIFLQNIRYLNWIQQFRPA
ncbi:MAG: hypothetical protein K9K82_03185 [Desulfobacteraceae bacterium]|nr:hypothetical protein [Desulfobacteraceae bacterium]